MGATSSKKGSSRRPGSLSAGTASLKSVEITTLDDGIAGMASVKSVKIT